MAETFLVAWRRLDQVPAEPLPWLLGVARRVIATRQRGNRRLANLRDVLRMNTDRVQLDSLPDDRGDLAAAFNALSPPDQEVLMLIGWDGLTVAQAAEVLGCNPESLSLRLHRARRRLEARIDSEARFRSPRPIPTTEEAR